MKHTQAHGSWVSARIFCDPDDSLSRVGRIILTRARRDADCIALQTRDVHCAASAQQEDTDAWLRLGWRES